LNFADFDWHRDNKKEFNPRDIMSKDTWKDYYDEVKFAMRCKTLYDYIKKHFNHMHNTLAARDFIQFTHILQFTQTLQAWMTMGCPQPLEAFIVWYFDFKSSVGYVVHHTIASERFNVFKQNYKCVFDDMFDINTVRNLYQQPDIVSLQKTLDQALANCKSIIEEINGDITTHLNK